MKQIICSILCLIVTQALLAQDTSMVERTYNNVVKTGLSTAPDFVVIVVKNLNTGQSKEICADAISLYWSLEQEHIDEFEKNSSLYLLSKSKDRIFNFKSPEALERLDFDKYTLSKKDEIELLIKKDHLRDSLKKINKLEEFQLNEFYKYSDKRADILDDISDSIKMKRPLTEEEEKMIKDLSDQYYDEYYTNPIYNQYRKVSPQGQQLMLLWNSKIKKYRDKYQLIGKELNRLNNKFFKNYYNRFGISFCHVAFKNGIVTYIADESGIVSYASVVD